LPVLIVLIFAALGSAAWMFLSYSPRRSAGLEAVL
jgi:hypothetical protein